MAGPFPSQFLPDVPTSDDRFDAHSSVAEALRDTLVATDSGLLELVGPFGSGKSTVIELIRPRRPDDPAGPREDETRGAGAEGPPGDDTCPDGPARLDPATHTVVVFDGWAHQAATLRRSLLAAVLREVDPHGQLSDPQRAVGPPRTQATTTTRTAPGPWGLFAAVLVFLLPLFVVFVTPAAQNIEITALAEGGYVAEPADTHFPAAIAIAVGVLLAGFVLALASSRPRTYPFSPSPDPGPTAGLLTQHVESTRTETAPPGELDADTFETHLKTAVRSWTRPSGPRRPPRVLLLVLDDLDRFPNRDRDKAWAVLRSLHRLTSGKDRLRGLWVVVPNVPAPSTRLVPDGEGTYTPDGWPRQTALAWADKLFLAQFTVPPTLPSPSADYLESLLGDAFPTHLSEHPEELAAAARARIWHGPKPTPRDAVRFVNDLVALYRQHGDSPVPLRVQAAYLTRQRAEEPLVPKDHARLAAELGVPDWPTVVATLHHGLPPDRAAETYLAERLHAAVYEGDRSAVEEALLVSERATIRVLHRTVSTVNASQVPLIVDNAAWTLDALPGEYVDARLEWDTRLAWGHLDAVAARVREWTHLSADGAGGRGLGAVLARAALRAPDRLVPMFRAINASLVEAQDPSGPEEEGGDSSTETTASTPADEGVAAWAAVAVPAMDEALRRISETGSEINRLGAYRVPGSPEQYLRAVDAAIAQTEAASTTGLPGEGEARAPGHDGRRRALRLLRPDAPAHEVVRLLASRCEHHDGAAGMGRRIGGLVAVDADWTWRLVVDVLRRRVAVATGPQSLMETLLSTADAEGAVVALLHIAHRSRQNSRDAESALRDLVSAGALQMLFQVPRAPDEDPAASARVKNAVALATRLHGVEQADATREAGASGEGQQLPRELTMWMVNRWTAVEQLAASVGAFDALAARGLP